MFALLEMAVGVKVDSGHIMLIAAAACITVTVSQNSIGR